MTTMQSGYPMVADQLTSGKYYPDGWFDLVNAQRKAMESIVPFPKCIIFKHRTLSPFTPFSTEIKNIDDFKPFEGRINILENGGFTIIVKKGN